jgi:ribosomal protein L37AE/L43A
MEPGPNGYEIAPDTFVSTEATSTWKCPNCGQSYTGTLGDLLDNMLIVVVKTTNRELDTWHGCTACEAQAPMLDPGV